MDLYRVQFAKQGKDGFMRRGLNACDPCIYEMFVRSSSFDQAAKKALLGIPECEREGTYVTCIMKVEYYID